MRLPYQLDRSFSGAMISEHFHCPISGCFKFYKRKGWLKRNISECQLLVDIEFSDSLFKRPFVKAAEYVVRVEKRTSNYPESHGPNLHTLLLDYFLLTVTLLPLLIFSINKRTYIHYRSFS